MESLSTVVLAVLGMVVFNNYRNGTLPDWLKAKFFNAGAPSPSSQADASTSGAGVRPASFTDVAQGVTGRLVAPVSAPVTSGFGAPRPGGRRHAGLDYGVPTGTPVGAAGAGRVTYAGSSSGYGLRVDVDHGGGLTTRYAHLDRIGVKVGQTVRGGQSLGTSGNTGRSTGPHLHFEVRRNGTAVDPAGVLSSDLAGVVADQRAVTA